MPPVKRASIKTSAPSSSTKSQTSNGNPASDNRQSAPNVDPKKEAQPNAQPTDGASERSPEEQAPEERPDIDFVLDVNPDLTLPIRAEDALGMEEELDAEMERELLNENVEPWAARLLVQAWSTEPMTEDYEAYGKYRIDGREAYKALKNKDPIYAMGFAHLTALQSTILFRLQEAGRSYKASPEVQERRYRSISKLTDSMTRLMTALGKYESKGKQTVSVRYERHDHGSVSRAKVSRSQSRRVTVKRTGLGDNFSKSGEEKEPITREATKKEPSRGKGK
jgi:hypothetical protein